MRAEVVDGEILALMIEDGDEAIAELEGCTFALGNRADLGDGGEAVIV